MIAPAGMPRIKRVAVLTVCGHNGIVGTQLRDDASRNGFLPDVEVEEPANLHLPVELGTPFLKDAYPDHVGQHVSSEGRSSRRLRRGRDFQGRKVADVQAQFPCLQETAHDLAAAGVRQRVSEFDLPGGHGRAQPLSGVAR